MNAVSLGCRTDLMMESAGKALADFAKRESPGYVVVLCGKGNNGGDGMVAARYLAPDTDVNVWYLDQSPASPACERQRKILGHCDIPTHPFRCKGDLATLPMDLNRSDLVIDALLGTGAQGAPREPVDACVAMTNDSGKPVLAADIPTPGMNASRVLSFHRAKIPGAAEAGIGIPLEAEIFAGPGDVTLVPRRKASAHKGQGGRVLVIGGGPFQGAPYLAGLGALRAGADIVRIASPVFEPVPDLIYERLSGDVIQEEHLPRLLELVRQSDVVVCGNGLGSASHEVVLALAPYCKKAVFDADALRTPLPRADETILTPHAGEFQRITGLAAPDTLPERGAVVKTAAKGVTILLKGPIDIISDGTRVRFNRTGTPSMTVGGTGDVLAGVIGGLFCHMPAFEATVIGAYVNGRAGMAAEDQLGGGLLASDLLNYIPRELSGRSVTE